MPTRFRLPSGGTADVTPPLFGSYTHSGSQRLAPMPTAAMGDSTALTTTAITPDNADHIVAGDTLHWVGVSEPLSPQTIASQVLKGAIQCLEAHTNNNLFIQLLVVVVSNDGQTLLGTLLAETIDNTELATTIQNRFFSFTTAAYTITAGQDGARIVVEISVQGTPVATSQTQGHNASLRFGSSGAGGDLPEDDTSTGTTLNPWIEFANVLTFAPVQVEIAGAISSSGSASGGASVVQPVQGAVAGNGSSNGAAAILAAIAGAVAGAGSSVGSLVNRIPMSGESSSVASLSAALAQRLALLGASAGQGTPFGDLSIQAASGEVEISGSVLGSGSAVAALLLRQELSGTVSGNGEAAGDLLQRLSLAGAVQGFGTPAALLQALIAMHGNTAGSASAAGSLDAVIALAGDVLAAALVEGNLHLISGIVIPPCPTLVLLEPSLRDILLEPDGRAVLLDTHTTGVILIC